MGQIWSDPLSCNKEAEHLEIFLLEYFENRTEPAERKSNFDSWFGLILHSCPIILRFVPLLWFIIKNCVSNRNPFYPLKQFYFINCSWILNECKVARTYKSYSRACTVYISDSEPHKSGSLPESSRTNPTPDNFVFHTII